MNKVINIFVAFVILSLGGCATLPPPKPLDPQRAAIGISVKWWQILGPALSADQVFLIKLDEEEDLYSQQDFIRSNYDKDGQIYLLNAKPGRYAAVGCYQVLTFPRRVDYTTIFSKELIKLTEITVAPGTIAFMGEYVFKSSYGFEDADGAQIHYFPLIAPGGQSSLIAAVLTGHCYFKGSLHEADCDKQAEIRFLTNATNHFKDTDWVNIVERRIADLKAEK